MITAAQRAAYHEAARVHSIPALAAWVVTLLVAAVSFAVQLTERGGA